MKSSRAGSLTAYLLRLHTHQNWRCISILIPYTPCSGLCESCAL
jgi:hypothetical protein